MTLFTQVALAALVVGGTQETEVADATPKSADVEASDAVQTAIAFLLGTQEAYVVDPPVGSLPPKELSGWQERESKRLAGLRKEGEGAEWPYEGVYRVKPDGRIPPGYRVGGTSIVCEALLRTVTDEAQLKESNAAISRSLAFVLDMIDNDEQMAIGPKRGYDVRGWGHAYALQFLLLAKEKGVVTDDEQMAHVEKTIPELISRLDANQTKMGGWNYAGDADVSPFMTGSTLLILFEAKKAGYEVDGAMIEKALDALEANRQEDGVYVYSGKVRREEKMPASSARSSVAELALFKAGRSDVDGLRQAVDGFFVGWDDLLDRKSKQGTHKGAYSIAPYYFFFGHTYAALAIEELPEKEAKARRTELAGLLWKTREEDGSWNDRIFPRTASYSTAMSVLALTAPDRPKYPTWKK